MYLLLLFHGIFYISTQTFKNSKLYIFIDSRSLALAYFYSDSVCITPSRLKLKLLLLKYIIIGSIE